MSPQHITSTAPEEAAAQMPGATGRESLLFVAGVCPRKAIRIVAPADESPRHHSDSRTLAKKAQDQVIVLGPGSVSIGILGQCSASDHERGVGDRTFDEAIAPEGFGIAD